MAVGRSVHVGVDTNTKQAGAFERDAVNMHRFAVELGYQAEPPLLGAKATISAVNEAIARAVKDTGEEDVLLLSFSTHGTSLRARSEHLHLADGTFADVQLHGLLAGLRHGARAIVVVDACSSSGMANKNSIWPGRVAPLVGSLARFVLLGARTATGKAIRRSAFPLLAPLAGERLRLATYGAASPPTDDFRATVHEMTAADKHEISRADCYGEGCFTRALIKRARTPGRGGTYTDLVATLRGDLAGKHQTPRYWCYGPALRTDEVPFAI